LWHVKRRVPDQDASYGYAALRQAIDADAATLETVAAQIRSIFSLGRFGTPEEIATTALDLCARESAFIVGTEIIADRGMSQL